MVERKGDGPAGWMDGGMDELKASSTESEAAVLMVAWRDT